MTAALYWNNLSPEERASVCEKNGLDRNQVVPFCALPFSNLPRAMKLAVDRAAECEIPELSGIASYLSLPDRIVIWMEKPSPCTCGVMTAVFINTDGKTHCVCCIPLDKRA